MGLSNDERGWVMTALSGLACIFGASFICIDIIVRQFPGKRDFRIQDSDVFLSVSLSLSFGVMLFSALYSMLPSSKSSLREGGYTSSEATWIMIGCFIGGAGGIQIVSQLFHHFIPHNVVGCEHTHDSGKSVKETPEMHEAALHDEHDHDHDHNHDHDHEHHHSQMTSHPNQSKTLSTPTGADDSRPSLPTRIKTSISQLTTGKDPSCQSEGPCYGYTDVCEDDCLVKLVGPASERPLPSAATESTPLLAQVQDDTNHHRPHTSTPEATSSATDSQTREQTRQHHEQRQHPHQHQHRPQHNSSHGDSPTSPPDDLTASQHSHHHHVPQNTFLSIGLQTSLAIALHKLPEGFITYATNHANPKLGVSVFLALFIHNITEGFALALPLYLAINSRLRAMAVSFVLGGLSQPLGAGVAALWFALASGSHGDDHDPAGHPGRLPTPSDAAYGAMFAITAGILANVALQLFSEALERTHHRTLCLIGAFVGMGILGVSSALTA